MLLVARGWSVCVRGAGGEDREEEVRVYLCGSSRNGGERKLISGMEGSGRRLIVRILVSLSFILFP
jgi:hypothetical protein